MKRLIKSILTVAAITALSLSATARTSYRGFVDIDPTIAISYSSLSFSDGAEYLSEYYSLYKKPADFGINVTSTHGVQLNRHFFVGAGLGLMMQFSSGTRNGDFDSKYDSETELSLSAPVFAAFRWDMDIAAKVTPFVSCKLGYIVKINKSGTINIVDEEGHRYGPPSLADGGFYYQPTLGVRFRMNRNLGFNLGLTLYPSYFKATDYNDSASYTRLNFGLNLGLDF